MTAVLERAQSRSPEHDRRHPSRLARWWGGWRVALRLARRDASRGKARALLVVLLIALPVAVTSGVLVYGKAEQALQSPRAGALQSLGSADARLFTYAGAARQSVYADTMNSGDGSAPVSDRAALLAALPPGSRLVSNGGLAGGVLESGDWGVPISLSVHDVRDPLVAGMWRLTDGRLPSTGSEIALDPDVAARLHAGVGDSVRLTPHGSPAVQLTVVGLARPNSSAGVDGAVLPGTMAVENGNEVQPAEADLLASTPTPLTWADIRRLNALGAVVTDRAVIENPPAFCPPSGVICLDSGPAAPPEPDSSVPVDPAEAARQAALVGVVLVLVVLQIALLAGPAFAVQLRRRQRELGLVGASGGSAADLRRTVLASGVLLGAMGGLAGVAVGWLGVWLLGGVLPWAPLSYGSEPLGVPPLPTLVWGAALVGLVAAVVAAVVPAVVAGRGDVVDTLRGRRPLPPVRSRTPVLGLGAGLVGIAVLLYGRAEADPLVLGVGVILGELGLVLMMPWLVVQAGRVGGRLPLSPRLAVRDAGRHRLRTATAACAIAAAAAAAVATSTWQTSQRLSFGSSDVAYVEGSLVVPSSSDYSTGTLGGDASVPPAPAAVDSVIASALPGAIRVGLRDVVPVVFGTSVPSGPSQAYDFLECLAPGGTPPAADVVATGSPATTACYSRSTRGATWTHSSVVLIEDPHALGRLLGPLAPVEEAERTLAAGGAVVLQPHTLDAQGKVWVRGNSTTADGSLSYGTPIALPATEVLTGALPATVVVGPAAFTAGHPLAGKAEAETSRRIVVVVPAEADRPDRPTAQQRLQIAFLKAGVPLTALTNDLPEDSTGLILAAAAAATLLMALLAGLMVTALALADGRADLATLAAVGARPGVRRRMAASTAGFVSALGCAAGVVSGLVLARLLVGVVTSSGSRVFAVHWSLVLGVLVAIPAATAAVAWLTTRSRVVLTRRTDF